jgi:hypothetical protein
VSRRTIAPAATKTTRRAATAKRAQPAWLAATLITTMKPGADLGDFVAEQLAALKAGGYVRGIIDLRHAEPEQWTAADWRLLTTMGDARTPEHFVLEYADIHVGDCWALLHGERGLVRFMFHDLKTAVGWVAWHQFKRQVMGEFASPCFV